MALKQLTPEQIQTMTLEEKDQWWLENVYRGDAPQLTWRSGITGMLLGGVLSLTNLYIGARTGWSLGVGITSVILAFAIFKIFSKIGLGKEMSVLENNAMQSIATSAGYATSPLISSLAAYTMVTAAIIPMHVALVWMFVLAVLGVLFAFPMKKRFINDEQHPFPEGMAAGVVMDALHESDEKEGLFKAKLLVAGAFVSGLIELVRSEKLMRSLLALRPFPEFYDELFYGERMSELGKKLRSGPSLFGTRLDELTLRWDTSIVFIATGGLMGIRTGVSMLVGGLLNYVVLAPILIRDHIITPRGGLACLASGDCHYGFRQISLWALWGGVACMTTSSLYAFFSKPKMILQSFSGLFAKRRGKTDVLAHIELPIKLSLIGVPVLGVVTAILGKMWFGISIWLGLIAVPLVFVFSLIATNATAITSITPTGALSKLTQLTYAALAPKNITTNLATAGITGEVSLNTANLLMDIKPGYMLGAKPRQQAVGHVLGAIAGLLVSVPVWYVIFIHGDIGRYGSDNIPVPAALTWKAVSEVLMKGLDFLHPTARDAVIVGAVIGIVFELAKQVTKNKFPLSAIGFGLAFVLPFTDIWTMFLGSFIFWVIGRAAAKKEAAAKKAQGAALESPKTEPERWYQLAHENTEAICAGIIAGGSLMGVGINVLDVLVLPDVQQASPMAAAIKTIVGALKPPM